jgi:hypothetical protein
MGKIKPIVKLNGIIINIDEISNDNNGMYCPVGTFRISLNTLMKINSKGRMKHISTCTIIKAERWLLNLLTTLPPVAAPNATPKSQVPRIIPKHSSLPKKINRNSRITSTCAIVA